MANPWTRRIILGAAVVGVAGLFYWALRPQPVPVDMATIDRGDIEVTVEEEGVTRIRNVYQVFAPIGGRIDRTALEVGDSVKKGDTVIANIRPGDPPFLDERTMRELEAAKDAANASVSLADAEVARAQAELKLAQSDLERAKALARRGTISDKAYEEASTTVDMREASLAQALANLNLRRSELESARAKLIQPNHEETDVSGPQCCVEVMAPASGSVLAIPAKSSRVVQAATLLAEIGDPHDLEIVVDLLSADAVRVRPGAVARLINWGGPGTLDAVVRRIDPVGFTKVSSLGIEEQRVNTVLDLTGPEESYARLGHDFRVFVQIIVDNVANAVRVPLGALFRTGNDWAVFKVVDGKAVLTRLTLGERNDNFAEVASGLAEGDAVILHPSDSVEDGVAVEQRTAQ